MNKKMKILLIVMLALFAVSILWIAMYSDTLKIPERTTEDVFTTPAQTTTEATTQTTVMTTETTTDAMTEATTTDATTTEVIATTAQTMTEATTTEATTTEETTTEETTTEETTVAETTTVETTTEETTVAETTTPESGFERELTYAEFRNMSFEQQEEYIDSFPDFDAFVDWFKAAQSVYESEHGSTVITGDNINIGDYVN